MPSLRTQQPFPNSLGPDGGARSRLLALLIAVLVVSAVAAVQPVVPVAAYDEVSTDARALSERLFRNDHAGGDLVVVTEVAGAPTFTVVEDVDTPQEAESALRDAGTPSLLAVDWQEEATLTAVTGPLPQWPVTALGLNSAWTSSTGTGVTVAVVDSGVAAHPDIPNLLPGFSSVGGSITAGQADTYGHGTHVAGIIAAGSDGVGTTGVAHNARILPIRAFAGTSAPVADVATGIVKAVQEGAQVINMSFGFTSENAALTAAIDYAVANNVILVAATGNEANVVRWPAADPRVIAVGATKEDGNLWSWSNTGTQVDVVAPGRNVYSTVVANQYFPGVGGVTDGSYSYALASGTSMATPHVAGVAALVISRHPEATRDQVAGFLTSSATDKGTTGFDTSYGWGLVDPVGALAAADSALGAPVGVPGPVSDLRATASDGKINLSWTAAADNGAAITDYRIEYSANAGTTWTIFDDGVNTNTTVTVTGLDNGTDYRFRVAASNIVGWGVDATTTGTPVRELKPQTITFPGITQKDHPVTFTVNPEATSGLTVRVTSSTPTVCSVEGGAVRTLRAGTCTLQAAQDGDAYYRPAEPVERTFLVSGVTAAITSPDLERPLSGDVALNVRVLDLKEKAWIRLETGDRTLATLYLTPGAAQTTTLRFNTRSVESGALTLSVTSTGGRELYRDQYPVTTDHAAPTLAVSWAAGQRLRGDAAVPVQASDDRAIDSVAVFVGDAELAKQESAGPSIALTTTLLNDGLQEFRIVATDTAGNSRAIRRNFFVDNTAPTLSWSPVTRPGATKTTFVFTASDNDKVRLVELLDGDTVVSSVAGTASGITWLRPYPTEPSALRLRATDTAGNQTTTAVFYVQGEQRIKQPDVQVSSNTTNSARLTWAKPLSYDAPITGYQLLSQRSALNKDLIMAGDLSAGTEQSYLLDQTLTDNTTSYTLTGLSANYRYVFYLRACTNITCSVITRVTVDTAPKPVTNLRASWAPGAAGGSVLVAWDSPHMPTLQIPCLTVPTLPQPTLPAASATSLTVPVPTLPVLPVPEIAQPLAPVTTRLFYRPAEETAWSEWVSPGCATSSLNSPTPLTGLSVNTTYVVKVVTTARGLSAESTWLGGVRPLQRPSAPAVRSGTATDSSITLTWERGVGSGKVDYYQIYVDGALGSTTSGFTDTVYGLKPDTSYNIAVAACAYSDLCTWSAYTRYQTATAPVMPPRWVRVTPGVEALLVEWSPSYAKGATIQSYRATATPGGSTCETTGYSCRIYGLDGGTEYSVTVQARTTAAYGAGSSRRADSVATTLSALSISYQQQGDILEAVTNGGGSSQYSITGELPAGVTFNANTGHISGVSKLNEGVMDVAVGWAYTCVLTTLGWVRCLETHEDRDVTANIVGGLPQSVVDIDGGGGHVCAVLANGSVRCWGRNYGYQLGTRTPVPGCEDCEELSETPVTVPGLTGKVVTLSAGGAGTCVLYIDGRGGCWGNGTRYVDLPSGGQLGLIRQVEASGENFCALYDLGVALCWSGWFNDLEKLSPGSSSRYEFDPATVEIAGGGGTLCGRTAEGVVACGGSNWAGGTGRGYFSQDVLEVAPVRGALNAQELFASGSSTCALNIDQVLYCWGYNQGGGLGVGTDADRNTPTRVPGLVGVRVLDMSETWGCAVTTAYSLRCWGSGADQFAPDSDNYYEDPVLKGALGAVADVGDGDCAVTMDGRLVCWGSNHAWLNGENGRRSGSAPVPVLDLQGDVAQVGNRCVVLTDGTVWCRSEGVYPYYEFYRVEGLDGDVVSLHEGAFSCALLATGGVRCWSYSFTDDEGLGRAEVWSVNGLPDDVRSLAVGDGSACALLTDASIRCWGYNWSGQLGTGVRDYAYEQEPDIRTAVKPTGIPAVSHMAIIGSSACVLSITGDAYCWGQILGGSSEQDPGDAAATPTKIAELGSGLSALYMTRHSGGGAWGVDTVCGGAPDSNLLCWSNNWSRWQEGPAEAQEFSFATSDVKKFAGDCLLTQGGAVYCWGDNWGGRISDQNWYRPLPVPVADGEAKGYPVTVTVRSGAQTKTVTLLLGA
jgi:subtilisin family serine protease